jgi:tape measure domain-containing protein
MANVYSTNIEISGKIDPSVASAIGLSVKELAKINAAYNTINKLQKQANLAANGLPPALVKTTVEITKTQRAAEALGNSFKRIGEIAAGVSIGDMISSGLERAVDLGKELVQQGIEFAKHASEAAASFELLSAGMGNLLRSQPMANSMLESLQQMAFKSPFQLTDLGSTAKQLIARGIDPNQVVRRTGQIGDIAAGLGLGKEGMDRLTLSYGESISGQTLNTKEINQMTMEGVPVWQELEKFTGKTVAQLHKLIEKHEISSQIMNKIFADLTGPDGLFFHGMTNFANTFRGKVTTFEDMFGRAERDFGNIVNDWVGDLLQLVNDSPVWQNAHEYFEELRKMSQSVISFIGTLPSSALWGKFQPYIDGMEKALGSVNNFIGGFFSEINTPTGGIQWVLNATGDQKVREMLDNITEMFSKIAEFVSSKSIQTLSSFTWSSLQQGLKDMFTGIEEMADLMADLANGNWGKLVSDLKKYEVDIPGRDNRSESLMSHHGYNDWGNSVRPMGVPYDPTKYTDMPMVNINGKMYTDADNQLYYEHLNEGRSSRIGPMNNQLGYGYGIGIGKVKAQETGATYGKWVKVRLPNGSTIIRQVNETSSRDHGIELESPSGDESSYGNGRAEIKGVYNTRSEAEKSNSMPSVNYNPTYNITGDADHVIRVMKDHHHVLAKHVADAVREHQSLRAVV